MLQFGYKKNGSGLPRTGLLLYLRTPNGTGAAAGKYVATAGSASIFAALGSDWYTDVATPKALTAAEILALASVNDYHILFSLTKGLAIYDPYTTAQADIDKAHAFYRVSIYADDVPTAFFNGLDTAGMTSYTGGPTYAPDHLGVLRSPGAGRPALQGMRLATTLADGAVLGPELWLYSATPSATLIRDGTDIIFVLSVAFSGAYYSGAGIQNGKYYSYRLIVSEFQGSGNLRFYLGNVPLITINANGTYENKWLASGIANNGIYIRAETPSPVSCRVSISVKEVLPTYFSTDISGAPIVASVEQKTRTGNADFTEFIAGTTFKKYTRTNPATDMPGYLSEPARTNKCTCRKANPVDTTNVTKAGDAAAVLSVVDDTAALTAAGLMGYPDSPCTTGKVYKLDNSSGTGFAFVALSGAAGNINAHSLSVYARKSGVAVAVLKFNIDVAEKTIPVSTGYIQTLHQNVTPGASSRLLELAVGAGSIIHFILPQLEEGPSCTSPIAKLQDGTDPLTAITRAGTVLTYPTAGKIRSNNIAIRKLIVPRATGQSGVHVYGTYTDANNYTALLMSPTSLTLRKRVAGVDTDATASITHGAGVPLEIIGVRSTTYGMQLAARAYSGGAWGAWINGTAVTTAAAKADAVIASTFQLGALNSANQMTGNLPLFDTLLIPEGISDPLAWAKAQWGLPA